MNGNVSKRVNRAEEYPDHLNPFDDNYAGELEAWNSATKYNTWGVAKDRRVVPASESKPWSGSASPKSKLVRRLSLLKNSVGRLSFRRPRRSSIGGDQRLAASSPPSGGPGHEFSFTIISPKVKERIRRQVFRTPPDAATEDTGEPCAERLKEELANTISPPTNPPTIPMTSPPTSPPTSPQPPPRAKPRKKRPPPPPPPQRSVSLTAAPVDPTASPKSGGSPECHSASSSLTDSLTRDLEADALTLSDTEEDHSISLFLTETKTKESKTIDKAKD